ncbi:MAG: DUF3810 family protein [Vicinamibacterales bacterium]
MSRLIRGCSLLVVIAAIAAGVLGAPAAFIDVYARSLYPSMQGYVTPLSNRTSVPLFDVAWMALIVVAIVAEIAALRRSRRRRTARPVLAATWLIVTLGALCYLWFLTAWGWNYRRPGVEAGLSAFDRSRVTPAAVRDLAERAVHQTNTLHDTAHARGFPAPDAIPIPLADALHTVERSLGRTRPTAPSRPKRPLTAPYMRAVGVSGMLAPFFLETYVSPDLTGPERPYVLAHEWAHLSGYAPEEDASFVGILAALRADVSSRYSAWLFLVTEAAMRLDPDARRQVLAPLEAGPRQDLEEIARRAALRVPWLDRASWVAYDRAIKSQGARRGVAGYGRVIELLIGSGALPEGSPS